MQLCFINEIEARIESDTDCMLLRKKVYMEMQLSSLSYAWQLIHQWKERNMMWYWGGIEGAYLWMQTEGIATSLRDGRTYKILSSYLCV